VSAIMPLVSSPLCNQSVWAWLEPELILNTKKSDKIAFYGSS